MKATLIEAIKIIKRHQKESEADMLMSSELSEAIDTVVAELEKPLPTDDEIRNMANEIGEKEVWPIGRQTGFVKGAKWMRDLIQEGRSK